MSNCYSSGATHSNVTINQSNDNNINDFKEVTPGNCGRKIIANKIPHPNIVTPNQFHYFVVDDESNFEDEIECHLSQRGI